VYGAVAAGYSDDGYSRGGGQLSRIFGRRPAERIWKTYDAPLRMLVPDCGAWLCAG
jgi:hypothetical protein